VKQNARGFLAGALGALSLAASAEDTYKLGAPPFLPEAQVRALYQPLADYLSARIGARIVVEPAPNFSAYWDRINEDRYDLALDGGHFVDYRIHFLGHTLLAKLKGVQTYTLVADTRQGILEVKDLAGRRVAALPIPSLPGAQVEALFPEPLHYPTVVEVGNIADAERLLREGQVAAAVLPSSSIATLANALVLTTTRPVPNLGLTAGARVPAPVRRRLRQALLDAETTEEGRRLLELACQAGFEAAPAEVYKGMHEHLRSAWGYKGKEN
jgi:ABC-type phosphate/phosphonate transport system substrate-binding protein